MVRFLDALLYHFLLSLNSTASLQKLSVVSPSLTNSKPSSPPTSNALTDFARRFSNVLSRVNWCLRTQPMNRQACCSNESVLNVNVQRRSQKWHHHRPKLLNS